MSKALRSDMMRVQLNLIGSSLVFDKMESDNNSITIHKIRFDDDAKQVQELIQAARTNVAYIACFPLDSMGEVSGEPVIYRGMAHIITSYDSNSASELMLLTVKIPEAVIG